MRDRRVDLERLARVLQLLLLGQRTERAHVVQPVGQLDDHDAHVARHRQHHLAVALGLRLLARVEVDARQLRDAVDEQRDVVAELDRDLLERRVGVLDRVVQQRRDDHRRLGAQPRADARHAERVHDVRLARLAHLIRRAARRRTRRRARSRRCRRRPRLPAASRPARRPEAGAARRADGGYVPESTSDLPWYRRRDVSQRLLRSRSRVRRALGQQRVELRERLGAPPLVQRVGRGGRKIALAGHRELAQTAFVQLDDTALGERRDRCVDEVGRRRHVGPRGARPQLFERRRRSPARPRARARP